MSLEYKARNKAAIQEWLRMQMAESLYVDPAQIDVREPFASYGLSSVAAISLTADLEDWLQIRLEPTLAWDYPTIELLARYLSDELEYALDSEQTGQRSSTRREFS